MLERLTTLAAIVTFVYGEISMPLKSTVLRHKKHKALHPLNFLPEAGLIKGTASQNVTNSQNVRLT